MLKGLKNLCQFIRRWWRTFRLTNARPVVGIQLGAPQPKAPEAKRFMMEDLNDLYKEVILDHSKNPKNFYKLDTANRKAEGHNPLCGDRVTVYLSVKDDVIQEVSFQGSGCAISKASASMMTEALKGKTKVEAEAVFHKFHEMVAKGAPPNEDLGKLEVFSGVNKFPARVKCAILPWHALAATLDGGENVVVKTE